MCSDRAFTGQYQQGKTFVAGSMVYSFGARGGFGDSVFTVTCLDDRVVDRACLWPNGIVPSTCREQLPDNATVSGRRLYYATTTLIALLGATVAGLWALSTIIGLQVPEPARAAEVAHVIGKDAAGIRDAERAAADHQARLRKLVLSAAALGAVAPTADFVLPELRGVS